MFGSWPTGSKSQDIWASAALIFYQTSPLSSWKYSTKLLQYLFQETEVDVIESAVPQNHDK